MTEEDDHLKSYLRYYMDLDKPGYAVLVTGAWGTGKTYQVREAIPEDRRYYISLFGLTDADQVSRSVYAEVHPSLSRLKNFLDKAEDVSKSMNGLFALEALGASGVKSLIKDEIATNKVLIFDDLERSTLGIDEKLGLVNLFVEQLGCKVIIIANDKEIADRFDEKKEKLIGRTIRAEPKLDDAFNAFANALNADGRSFVQKHKAKIVSTFKCSGRESLRVLKYVIDDLSRLRSHLADKFTGNDHAIAELVQLFTALDIETRYGSLTEADLRNRQHSYIISAMRKSTESQAAIKTISDKYSPLDLTSTLISDELAVSLFIRGSYTSGEIEQSLKGSSYFGDKSELPSWLGVYQFYKISSDEAQHFFDRLLLDLDQHNVIVPGEILHSFAMLLLMSRYGLVDDTYADIVKKARQYLENLSTKHPTTTDIMIDDLETGYGGYGFWVDEECLNEFNEIRGEVIKFQKTTLEMSFPRFAAELMELLKKDAQEFYNEVCSNATRPPRFAVLPIFASVAPRDFLSALLSTSQSERRIVASALKDRYEGSRFQNELSKEIPWIKEVLELVDAKADELTGFASLQLKILFGSYFRDRVAELVANDEDAPPRQQAGGN